MTVAAAIEIGTGKTLTPGLDKTQGAARGAGQAAANQALSQPNAAGAESFRSGLQSLLASLGSGMEGLSETEAETNQGAASAEQTLSDAAEKFPVSTSTPEAGAGLRVRQEAEKGTGLASAGLKVSEADARTEASAALSTTEVKTTSAGSANEKKTPANRESESTSSSRLIHSAKAAVAGVIAAASLPEVIPVATASLSQPVPVAAVASPIAQSTHAETSVDPAIDSPSKFASISSGLYSSNLDTVKEAGGTANATVRKSAEGFEESGKQGAALPVRNSSGSSGNVFDETDASAASESVTLLIAKRTDGGSSLETPATSQSLTPTQIPAPGQSEIPAQPGNLEVNVLPVAMDSNGLNASPTPANAAASRTESKPGTASEKKFSASDLQQSRRGTGNFASAQHGNPMVQGESSGAAADASATARAGAGAGGAASAIGDLTARASSATTGPDSREAFATIDAGGGTGKPTWIQAGAQRAEAGFQDPSLGWVGVRADTSGGGIHAELVPGSADAAQTLGSHMAGLNAYLAEHHTAVQTLTLTSPESGSSGLGGGAGTGGGTQQGPGHEASQGATQGTDSREQFASSAAPESPDWFAGRDGGGQAAGLEGHQISVMA